MFRNLASVLGGVMILVSCASVFAQQAEPQKEVLVFYKTEGFHHKSVDTAVKTIQKLGAENDFNVSSTKNTSIFLKEDIRNYDVVVFANTSGNVFNIEEQKAFRNYIENGGGFFGIHSAADTEGDWPFFVELVGGFFENHPKVQQADIYLNMEDHPAVSHLPKVWTFTDEWYNYKNLNPEIQVLLYLDETSYEGGTNGKEHPIAWFRKTGHGGISIFTGLGHSVESYIKPNFKEHILQSILFALGETKK